MLISSAYKEQNRLLHEARPDYGRSGQRWAAIVADLASKLQAGEVLDYGCGKETLAQALPGLSIRGYDPAISGLDLPPAPADLVICTDVLEHIEPDLLEAVLDDLKRVTRKALFASIHTGPAKKTLPDGRNAHLIQENVTWWLPRLWQRFDLQQATVRPNEIVALLTAKES